MTTHDLLKARFAFVRQDLSAILAQLSDSDLSWQPRQGMPAISDLLVEIANKEKETIAWLQSGIWPDGDSDAFDPKAASLAEINKVFANLRENTYQYIDSFTESELEDLISNPENWWEGMRIPVCPRSEILRNIAQHEWYHTAQLVTYLWILGENPAKS